MINVIASPAARPWVGEFFELFKTPWRFHEPDNDSDVLLCAAASDVPATSAKLVIVFGSDPGPSDGGEFETLDGSSGEIMLENGADQIPIYGRCLALPETPTSALKIRGNQGAAVRIVRKAEQTVIRVGYNLFEEVRWLLTRGQAEANAMIPTLDLHIDLVRSWIVQNGIGLVEIPPVPAGYRFGVCLTHDMDHPAIRHHGFDHTVLGFIGRASLGSALKFLGGRMTLAQVWRNWAAVLKLPFVYMRLAGDFWRQTDRYLEIERGLGSTFFVIPEKGNPGRAVNRENSQRRASAYGAADIADDLRHIAAAGHEVAVHGIDAWLDAERGRHESKRVADACGQPVKGVRMHWLCFDESSPKQLEAAGFNYDSTVGYNQCIGFRAGTLQVYRPAGVERLLELPLHIMDTSMFYPAYLHYSNEQAVHLVKVLVDRAVRFGGTLTVNWHDRSLAPERLWDDVYLRLVEMVRKEKAWFASASDSVTWFRRRRSASFEEIIDASGSAHVRVNVPSTDVQLPNLTVKIYNAPVADRSQTQTLECELKAGSHDVLGSASIAVAGAL